MEVKISITSKKGDLIKIKDKRKIDYEENKFNKIIQHPENTCAIEINNKKMSLHKSMHKVQKLPEISNQLVIMGINTNYQHLGYSIDVIKYLFNRYRFESFEQALWILGRDPDTNKYNHIFYIPSDYKNKSTQNSKNLCYICNDLLDKHDNCMENFNEFTTTQESHLKLLNDIDEKENDEVILKLKNKNMQAKFHKDYIQKLEKEFEKENLCFICYANEISPHSSFSLECKHRFCNQCVRSYFESKINDAMITNLKCLQPGCQFSYSEKIIEKIVPQNIFHRYLVIKNKEETKNRLQNGFIPCTYPDCQELVFYKDGNNPLVFCTKKHRFCAICKEGWHKNTECKNKNIQNILKHNEKIKMCPKCNIFIEKESGCNRMVCEMCNFEFCWLCLKKYEFYHYYVFNATGCPGMRYAKSTKSEVFENWFLNYLWYFLVIILSIIAVLFLVGFYLFFGASYEFVKCYLNSKNKRKDNKGSDNIQNNKSYPTKSDSNVTIASNDNEGGKSIKFVNLLIIFSLIICGIAVQPFFLMFKFLEGMMECYRTYGCLFFWFFW